MILCLPGHRRNKTLLALAICFFFGLFGVANSARDPGKVKLTKLSRLTLRNGQMTTGRRESPVPQLRCVGGDAKGLYEIDVMVCKNLGSDYGDDDVSWSCTAEVPSYFKLGSTDVLCEGYDHPDDPYVLRGSCGIEYRLHLTDAGYEKYGNRAFTLGGIFNSENKIASGLSILFVGIWIIAAVVACWRSVPQGGLGGLGGLGGQGGGGWGGGGGGGGGGWGTNNDPPPPYSGTGGPKIYPNSSTSSGQQGWRPGFWTGAAAGAAASHLLGRNRDDRRDRYGMGTPGVFGESSTAGPSRSGGLGGGSSGGFSGGGSASRSTTGFGQTRRR